MSTVQVSNITDGTNSVETVYVARGSAKAWVNFNGTGTIAARDSLNLSSLTDNGVGDYTVNVSSAFDNTNNVAHLMATNVPIGTGYLVSAICPTASSIQVLASNPVSLATQDSENSMISAIGDLA